MNHLVAWYEDLQNGPTDDVGQCAVAENDEITGWLALETHEGHLGTVSVVEELTGEFIDVE